MATKATAVLNNYRQSPRKVRLVADLMRGKKVGDVLTTLEFTTKKATSPLAKLLKSAIANAKEKGADEANLFIEKITVDGGPILYRRRARARGSAYAIRKRTSKVTLSLGEKEEKVKKVPAKKKATPTKAEKAAPKKKVTKKTK